MGLWLLARSLAARRKTRVGLADAGGAATWQLEELYHGELQRRKELALGIALNDMLSALELETSGECESARVR